MMQNAIKKYLKIYFLLPFLYLTLNSFSQGNWIQIWSDEFDYTGLPDTKKWSYETGCALYNNELQNYTASRLENARVESGNLVIEARKEASGGCNYSSARLITKFKGDWLYGRIEVKAKLPTGKGMWPAIWMMPTDAAYGGWPNSGEIDIMENVGYEPNRIFHTIHTQSYNSTIGTAKSANETVITPYSVYHVYAMEWFADHIDFFVDDVKEFTFTKEASNSKVWPFDKRFFLILNIAFGGTWGGSQGIDNSIFPQKMYVDYVRVYEWQASPGPYTVTLTTDGNGSVTSDPQQVTYPSATPLKITAIPNEGYRFANWTIQETGVSNNTDNPLNITVYKDLHIKANFVSTCERVLNGNFSSGLDNWMMVTNDGSQAATSVANGELKIQMTNKGVYTWSIQSLQTNLRIEKGNLYRVSFDAYSSANRNIEVFAGLNKNPWTNYLLKAASLTTQKQTFTYDFTMTYNTDTIARIGFNFGQAVSTIFIDNVSLCNLTILSANEMKNNKHPAFSVQQNNSEKMIKLNYSILSDERVTISMYDLTGKIIYTLNKGKLTTGDYSDEINYSKLNISSGLYVIKLSTQQENNIQKIFIQ